jgi:prevent-host-death family protein
MPDVGIEQARRDLGELVDKVRFTGEPVTITRKGRPAVLIAALPGVGWRYCGECGKCHPVTTPEREPANA